MKETVFVTIAFSDSPKITIEAKNIDTQKPKSSSSEHGARLIMANPSVKIFLSPGFQPATA